MTKSMSPSSHDTSREPLQKAIEQGLIQISKRDQKITWINAQRAAEAAQAAVEKEALEAVLRFTQEQVRTREAQLDEILNSRTWKIAVFLQRLRTFFVPPQSRREAILQQVSRMLQSILGKARKS